MHGNLLITQFIEKVVQYHSDGFSGVPVSPVRSEYPYAIFKGAVSLIALKSIQRADDFTLHVLYHEPEAIDPRLWKAVRGRKANADIEEDVPVTWEMLE